MLGEKSLEIYSEKQTHNRCRTTQKFISNHGHANSKLNDILSHGGTILYVVLAWLLSNSLHSPIGVSIIAFLQQLPV